MLSYSSFPLIWYTYTWHLSQTDRQLNFATLFLHLSYKTHGHVYSSCLRSTALHASETWPLTTVNPLYNDTVCSKLSLTLKWICCYKEILTITRFQHNNHLVKENIVQWIKMLFFQLYTSVQFHIASNCTKLPTYQVRQKPVHAKKTLLSS